MSRWQPDGRGRLERAALELYIERGFEQTTVADIAGRAGLTERTFFRHFADKREVLFSGQAALTDLIARQVADARPGSTPIDAVGEALRAVAEAIGGRREHSRRRQAVIDANPALQERELIKLASMSTALTAALRRRGVGESTARLAAEAGVAVLKVALERWLVGDGDETLGDMVADSLGDLKNFGAPE